MSLPSLSEPDQLKGIDFRESQAIYEYLLLSMKHSPNSFDQLSFAIIQTNIAVCV